MQNVKTLEISADTIGQDNMDKLHDAVKGFLKDAVDDIAKTMGKSKQKPVFADHDDLLEYCFPQDNERLSLMDLYASPGLPFRYAIKHQHYECAAALSALTFKDSFSYSGDMSRQIGLKMNNFSAKDNTLVNLLKNTITYEHLKRIPNNEANNGDVALQRALKLLIGKDHSLSHAPVENSIADQLAPQDMILSPAFRRDMFLAHYYGKVRDDVEVTMQQSIEARVFYSYATRFMDLSPDDMSLWELTKEAIKQMPEQREGKLFKAHLAYNLARVMLFDPILDKEEYDPHTDHIMLAETMITHASRTLVDLVLRHGITHDTLTQRDDYEGSKSLSPMEEVLEVLEVVFACVTITNCKLVTQHFTEMCFKDLKERLDGEIHLVEEHYLGIELLLRMIMVPAQGILDACFDTGFPMIANTSESPSAFPNLLEPFSDDVMKSVRRALKPGAVRGDTPTTLASSVTKMTPGYKQVLVGDYKRHAIYFGSLLSWAKVTRLCSHGRIQDTPVTMMTTMGLIRKAVEQYQYLLWFGTGELRDQLVNLSAVPLIKAECERRGSKPGDVFAGADPHDPDTLPDEILPEYNLTKPLHDAQWNTFDILAMQPLFTAARQGADEVKAEIGKANEGRATMNKMLAEISAMSKGDFDMARFQELTAKVAELGNSLEDQTRVADHPVAKAYVERLLGMIKGLPSVVDPEALGLLLKAEQEIKDYKEVVVECEKLAEEAMNHSELMENGMIEAKTKLMDTEAELERTKQALDAANSMNATRYGAAVQQDQDEEIQSIIAQMVMDGKESLTPYQVLRLMDYSAGDRLLVLPSAYESAKKSDFANGKRLAQELSKLGYEWLSVYQQTGLVSEAKQCFSTTVFRSGEGKTVSNNAKMKAERTFLHNGEQKLFTRHLAIGNSGSSQKHIRIYFDTELDEGPHGRVVIAYCGVHLTNTHS